MIAGRRLDVVGVLGDRDVREGPAGAFGVGQAFFGSGVWCRSAPAVAAVGGASALTGVREPCGTASPPASGWSVMITQPGREW
ncbi:hypothetical protein AQJ84_24000 [Streptomyces resistomycificus]|uniref:Uncharacterized protein n=1 Tax=Streptomyces resistomycificus TaxID=67356 RepID=A0A0L8LGJ2_9ACTN|nr:hypothetical protein ADK37_12280 [Streptomyces resistomycificus]KUN95131.1 hypothetical protein AQJ84_24000 [Streptomyces resistomycificus]